MRVLFAASEIYPFAKTGGLADVAHSLPKALGKRHDVTVVMPLYREIGRKKYAIEKREAFTVSMGGASYEVTLYGCRHDGMEYLFIYAPLLSEREYLYGPPEAGYEDNALRFGLFSHAIVALAKRIHSDIVHLNDWQTALAALLITEDAALRAKTVYTIHNLAYQGVFDASVLQLLGIDRKYFTPEGIEFYGKVNLMKAGIGYADAVTTVSPAYAKEICTPEFGCGLEGFLNAHANKLIGIVNGIDTAHFSPSADEALYRPYKTPRGKAYNKRRYLASTGLQGEEKPLFIFIGRFTWQKGMDTLISALPEMANEVCNIAILGEGETQYRSDIEAVAGRFGNVYCFFGYDEALAHRMYAAADFLLMPSLFEPCGLNQLIAMHYGAVPVVRRVGGLADTVKPYMLCGNGEGCGVLFNAPEVMELMSAFRDTLKLYTDKKTFGRIAVHNMKLDVSWHESAAVFETMYKKISD